MAKQKEQYVTFLNSAGEEISNDPRWIAHKTLAQYGVEAKAEDYDIPGDYDHITDGKELKALAKERDISIVGIRKASAIRELLEAWDEEQAQGNSDDDDDESTDDDQSGDSGNSKE